MQNWERADLLENKLEMKRVAMKRNAKRAEVCIRGRRDRERGETERSIQKASLRNSRDRRAASRRRETHALMSTHERGASEPSN